MIEIKPDNQMYCFPAETSPKEQQKKKIYPSIYDPVILLFSSQVTIPYRKIGEGTAELLFLDDYGIPVRGVKSSDCIVKKVYDKEDTIEIAGYFEEKVSSHAVPVAAANMQVFNKITYILLRWQLPLESGKTIHIIESFCPNFIREKLVYCIAKNYDLSQKRLFLKKIYRDSELVILGANGKWKINKEKASIAEVRGIFWEYCVPESWLTEEVVIFSVRSWYNPMVN